MAIPTVAEITAKIQSLLGDPNGETFTTALAKEGFDDAYRHLCLEMVRLQLPRKNRQITYTLVANTTSLTPATAGISNFGEIVWMKERLSGSTDKYTTVEPVEDLADRAAGEKLGEYEWREDTWYFVGATTARELKIEYQESDTPPASGGVGVDGSFMYLSYWGAASIASSRGRDGSDELQAKAQLYLDSLLQPMIRTLQKTRIQQPAYGVCPPRRKRHRYITVVEAPVISGGGGGGSSPMTEITVSGVQDGVNTTFTLSSAPTGILFLYLNGVLLTEGVGYTRASTTITFIAPTIPNAGDTIRAYNG